MRPHSNLFSHHPFIHLALALSAGICTASYFSLTFSVATAALCTAFTLTLFIKQRLRLATLALLAAVFIIGATLAILERRVDQSRELKNLVEQCDGE